MVSIDRVLAPLITGTDPLDHETQLDSLSMSVTMTSSPSDLPILLTARMRKSHLWPVLIHNNRSSQSSTFADMILER